MKNHFFQFFLILCFFVMLLFPSEVFEKLVTALVTSLFAYLYIRST